MPAPRILITGPLSNLDAYALAAVRAGWEPVVFPLLEIRHNRLCPWREPLRSPDWICITSQNAVPPLEVERERLAGVPCAAVGARSAEALRTLGFQVAIEGARTAKELLSRLLDRLVLPSLVLWPRGSRSDELARGLREAGADVHDPVVYETIERADGASLPQAEAILLSSPSAVSAYARRVHGGEPASGSAIAIGPTTLGALTTGDGPAFLRTEMLEEATPEGLRFTLEEWTK